MVKLLIIADDLTGALDTGIRFVDRGVSTQIVAEPAYHFEQTDEDVMVVVINSETRYVPPKYAYEIVKRIAESAVNAGIPHIYKKTDSALRGNLGSELQAVMDGTQQKRIHFIPALPALDRVTVEGIQYIDAIPLARSSYGKDSDHPVLCSRVDELLAGQSACPVYLHKIYEGKLEDGIHVYDAVTDRDMIRIAQQLMDDGELALTAGCSGFASVLLDPLELTGEQEHAYELPQSMLVVCASSNPVAEKQLSYAEASGFVRISLKSSQILHPQWTESEECRKLLPEWRHILETKKKLIIDVNDTMEVKSRECAAKLGMSAAEARSGVFDRLAILLKRMLDQGANGTLFLNGGDMLRAFMKQIHVKQLNPICEIAQGVVLSQVNYREQDYYLISKSSGFGKRTLIPELVKEMKEEY